MAAIDKTYLTWKQYLELKEWCKNTKLTYSSGKVGSPLDFLVNCDEPWEDEYPVWSTPWAFDEWLRENCPLSFIQERLNEQYGSDPIFEEDEVVNEPGTHYKVISKPKCNYRDCGYDIMEKDFCLLYSEDYNKWYTVRELCDPNENIAYCYYTKNLTKRKLNRLIKKWKLPKGTILEIRGTKYFNTSFVIKIK